MYSIFEYLDLLFDMFYILLLTRASHIMRITSTPLNRCVVHATSISYDFEIRILK